MAYVALLEASWQIREPLPSQWLERPPLHRRLYLFMFVPQTY